MLQVTVFILFIFSSTISFGQTNLEEVRFIPCTLEKYEISFTKNWANIIVIDVEINGVKKPFHFDTGASLISFSKEFYNYLYNNKYISDSDIIGKRKTLMGSGKEEEVLLINLKNIKIGDVYLTNIEAVVFENSEVPFLLGQNVFSKFDNITINNIENKIILEKKSEIENLKQYIKNDNSINVTLFTEENNPIQPKAINNLTNASITIRFFHPDDEQKAQKIKKLFLKNKYSAKTQSMLSKISGTIPNYIEIWIK